MLSITLFNFFKVKTRLEYKYYILVNFYYNFSGSVAVIEVGQMDFIIVGQRALYFPTPADRQENVVGK
nr:MAG TPA: hypothetical protein [Caudoviricetes sp.]